jgi:hypothetical protein
MRKRKVWLIGTLLIITALAAAWRFPATIYVPMGVLKQEAFYDGKPTSYWVRALKREPFLGQAVAAGDIGKTLREGGAAAVPVLCEIVRNTDPDVRMHGLFGLAAMGPDASASQSALAEAVTNEKQSAPFLLASTTLGKLNPAAATGVLSTVLRDKAESNGGRRAWALGVLLNLAPECKAAIPALNEIALDPTADMRLRVAAIRVLTRLQQPADPLVPVLCKAITVPKTPAGVQALEALGEMGPAGAPAVPTLVKLLDNPSLPAAGFPFGPPHRQAVVICLGEIGPPARPAVPALIACLNSGNDIVRIEVAAALTRIGPTAKKDLVARDAVWGTTLALLAASRPADLAVPVLAAICKRTWIPGGLQTRDEISAAIYKVDSSARARVLAGALKNF